MRQQREVAPHGQVATIHKFAKDRLGLAASTHHFRVWGQHPPWPVDQLFEASEQQETGASSPGPWVR